MFTKLVLLGLASACLTGVQGARLNGNKEENKVSTDKKDDKERELYYYYGQGGGQYGGYYGPGYGPGYGHGYPSYPYQPWRPPFPWYPPYYPSPPTPSPPTNQCSWPKQYNQCGTACPRTCEDPNPAQCTLQCVEGCFCPPGLVLDEASDTCVQLWQCPSTPPANQCEWPKRYNACGTACPRTCDDPNPGPCTLECVEGCFCPPGLVLDEATDQCVQFWQCPYTPPANQCTWPKVYNECGTACPRTCTDPNPTQCTLQCVEGCFCPPGLVLEEQSGQCIHFSQCYWYQH